MNQINFLIIPIVSKLVKLIFYEQVSRMFCNIKMHDGSVFMRNEKVNIAGMPEDTTLKQVNNRRTKQILLYLSKHKERYIRPGELKKN